MGNDVLAYKMIKKDKNRRSETMGTFKEKFEKLFMAVSFAEAGEHETAKEIVGDNARYKQVERKSPVARSRKELRAPGMKR